MKKILLCMLLLWGAIFTFGSCDVDIPEIEKPVLPEKDRMMRMILQLIPAAYSTIQK